jgi:hypothetical protein
MPDEIAQSQVSGTEEAPESGAEAPQSSEKPVEVAQPGAEDNKSKETPTTEDKNPKTGKTYSQADVDKLISERTSTIQKQEAEARNALARMEMERQIREMAAQEEQARAKDRQDVANGNLTEDEANQRATERQKLAQLKSTTAELGKRADAIGKVMLATDLAKKYGIEADKLLKDDSIKSPQAMIEKAADIALAERDAKIRQLTAKPETFDKGPGEAGAAIDVFNGEVTQAQLDDDNYWAKNSKAILKAQREGKLKVK